MKLIVAMVALAALLWASVGAFGAEADNAAVPPQIRAARNRHDAALKQAELAWLKSQLGVKTAYLAELQTILQETMKAGKLDDANAINVEKKKVEAEVASLRGRTASGWTVIFRSSNPMLWDTDTKGKGDELAVPLSEVSAKIRFLKMSVGKSGFVIIPITKDALAKGAEYESVGWGRSVGKTAVALGIWNKRKSVGKGGVEIGPKVTTGWGFGTHAYVHDHQAFVWDGKELPPTVFEISVTEGPLNAEESKALLE